MLLHCQQPTEGFGTVCRAKFDKFTPRLEDKVDPHTPVPFGEMFGQGVDDLIGGVSPMQCNNPDALLLLSIFLFLHALCRHASAKSHSKWPYAKSPACHTCAGPEASLQAWQQFSLPLLFYRAAALKTTSCCNDIHIVW